MKIHIDKLDRLFSEYIRARDKVCQRCGGSGGLQTAHFDGRARKSVRWDEDNACLLCCGCHMYLDGHPLEKVEFFKSRLGEEAFEFLQGRMRNIGMPDKGLIEIYLREKLAEFGGIIKGIDG